MRHKCCTIQKKSENQEMAQESRECKKLREHVRVSSVLSFECQKRNKVKSEAKGKKKAKKNTHRSSVGKLTVDFKEKKERT